METATLTDTSARRQGHATCAVTINLGMPSVLQNKQGKLPVGGAVKIVIAQHVPLVAPFRWNRIGNHTCVLCVHSHLVRADFPDLSPGNIACPSNRLGNAETADSKHSSYASMQQAATKEGFRLPNTIVFKYRYVGVASIDSSSHKC